MSQGDNLEFIVYEKREHYNLMESLSKRLADIDKREAFAMTGLTPVMALMTSLDNSSMGFLIFLEGKLEGAFGLCPALRSDNSTIYAPWMLVTNRLRKLCCKDLIDTPKEVIAEWKKMGTLSNFVSTENQRAIRWLRHLGFTVDTSQVFTFIGSMRFYRFSLKEG